MKLDLTRVGCFMQAENDRRSSGRPLQPGRCSGDGGRGGAPERTEDQEGLGCRRGQGSTAHNWQGDCAVTAGIPYRPFAFPQGVLNFEKFIDLLPIRSLIRSRIRIKYGKTKCQYRKTKGQEIKLLYPQQISN
jgi:hypothetical protein